MRQARQLRLARIIETPADTINKGVRFRRFAQAEIADAMIRAGG